MAADGRRRAQGEDEARQAFARGELSLDRYGLRAEVERLGIRYVRAGPPGSQGQVSQIRPARSL